jgi:hypothetical protein
MAGWVERRTAEWTELRVHGVSGTPPESMLEHPTVVRVAGDAASGFYRRSWQAESIADDDRANVLEAYSWGGLTAGSKLRALWLLLIPFLLANVAFYARPAHRPGLRQSAGEAVQRLFALTITVTLILATVNVSMDFVGWQCVRPGGTGSCSSAWVGWLSWPWLAAPGRRIAVTALLPLAVIALLWWLAHKTWAANEVTPVEAAPAAVKEQLPLENRRMWNSAKPVRRLRAVHVTAALALVGILALAPFVRDWPAGPTTGEVLMVVLLGVGALSVVLACLPGMSDRPTKDDEHKGARFTVFVVGLPWLTVALIAAALTWLWFADPVPTGSPGDPRTSLPWLSAAVHADIAVQAVLLLVMVVLLTLMRRDARGSAGPATVDTPVAWHGYGTAVLMLFGSALSGAYAAALVLAVAHLLGKPMPRDQGIDPMVTPLPYFWAAALALVIAGTALIFGVCGYLVVRVATSRRMLPAVREKYPHSAQDEARAKAIARQWAMATVDETFRRVAGWLVLVTVVLIGAAFVGYAAGRTAVTDTRVLSAMANVGDWLIGLFAAGLLYLGRQAYQNAGTRRIVGVIWDLGTFWPRAAHPLAPPCYAERAVPELINRIDHLRRGGRSNVLLSCHSQGTVLGAAVVMQLTYEQSANVALLTYGSPLRRLYARFFPAYFGPAALHRLGSFLLGGTDTAMPQWPWRNLYRPSDPIGGAVFAGCDVDCDLVDPVFTKPAGDIADPPTLGHSFYPDDPAWAATVAEVKALRMAAASPGREDGHRDAPLAPQFT